MQPGQKRRRFYIVTAAVFVGIIAAAVAIVVYTDYSYVNVRIEGNSNASFVLAYDSTNVTLSAAQNATVAVLAHANITVTAIINPSYAVSGWVVTGASFHSEGSDAIWFLTGSDGSTVTVAVDLENESAGPG